MIWFIIFFICVLAILFLFIIMWKQAHLNIVESIELSFDEFPKSFQEVKLFFISDIHRRKISPVLIDQVKEADFVIIGGDLTEKGVSFNQVKKNIELLKTIGPIYFVWGNNDYEVDVKSLRTLLIDKGVKILENAAVTYRSDQDETFALLGLDSLTNRKADLNLTLKESEAVSFKILACHDPRIVHHFNKEAGIQLVLSGHTHGGQIRFLGFGVYDKGGLKEYSHTKMLLSNGYGTTLLPLRLGVPAETHLITIKPS